MKKRKKNIFNIIAIFFLILFIIFVILFLIRLVTSTEIDDVTPGISCPELYKYNPDVLYVVPNFENIPISKNKEWCEYILSLNKTLELHGITHRYREFLYEEISQEELEYGISEFEKCFGFKPKKFKAPQLELSKKNRKLIKENNLEIRNLFNQLTHKVYHCGDSDIISNKIVNLL